MESSNRTYIEISTSSLIKFLIFIIAILFVYIIRDVILVLFIAFVIASAITPWVDQLERWHIPRTLGALSLLVSVIGFVSILIILIIPPLTSEIKQITLTIPQYYEELSRARPEGEELPVYITALQGALENINQAIQRMGGGLFDTAIRIFGGIFSFIGVLVITFYITLEKDALKKFISSIFPATYQPYLIRLTNRIQARLGYWLRGELFLAFIVGLLVYIGLLILKVPYAILLALIAGVGEVIPVIGPILSAIPAVIIGLAQSPLKGLLVLVLFVLVQQVENHLIVPKVMQKAVGLNPIVIILALLIGGRLGGIMGMVLAVPVATIISIVVKDIFEEIRAEDKKLEV